MPEIVQFKFDGKISSEGRMDFYESARFQYSASRLLVKLDNFRRTGNFPKKISSQNRHEIEVKEFQRGSFGIEIAIPLIMAAGPMVFEVSISTLFSYVVERIFKPTDNEVALAALATNRNLVEALNNRADAQENITQNILDLLRNEIDHGRELSTQNRELLERILSDRDRASMLQRDRQVLRQMSMDQEADLITMSAPLLKEMNVPLRRSASHLTVTTGIGADKRRIIHVNKEMADEVDIAIVDRDITTIDIHVVQFNRENGWGKFRNVEWEGVPSFSVPSDLLDEIRELIVAAMNLNMVSVDCYFVRSPAQVPLRIIVVDVRMVEQE